MAIYFLVISALAAISFYLLINSNKELPYHAYYAATATLIGGLFVLFLLTVLAQLDEIWQHPLLILLALVFVAVGAIYHSYNLLNKRARHGFERLAMLFLQMSACLAILITVGIVVAVTAESIHFFQLVPIEEFLFGIKWSPQATINDGQANYIGSFGLVPVMAGTLLITFIAMLFATPIGLASAIYLSEFASTKTRTRIKPAIELLAGVPTVVYGFFAVVTLSPLLRDLGSSLGQNIAGESALLAGIVMGIMLIPFITSLAEDALFAVPDSMRQGALALGATRYEVAAQVIFPAALSGIVAGLLLAISRAIGETMIVVMAAGIAAKLTINPLEAVTTVTVQIVSLITGDQSFDDPKTLAAFALGLSLFLITLLMNIIALLVVRRFREHYE